MIEEPGSRGANSERLWARAEGTADAAPKSGERSTPSLSPVTPHSPPAGWYPNPQGPGQRYWDGAQWTQHFFSEPAVAGVRSTSTSGRPAAFWVAIASIAAMAIGAFGPWVTALGGTVAVNGTSGGRDGWLVIGAALIGAAFLYTYASRGIASRLTGTAIFGVLGAAVCIYDLVDISNTTADFFGQNLQIAHPGWGIYLGLAGSAALAVSSVVLRQASRS